MAPPWVSPLQYAAPKSTPYSWRDRRGIGCLQRVGDSDAEFVTPTDMLTELRDDNEQLAAHMRETHGRCGDHDDLATASLLEVSINEAERRTWFLLGGTRGD
jgi:starvation-inducible DNA-binding protein